MEYVVKTLRSGVLRLGSWNHALGSAPCIEDAVAGSAMELEAIRGDGIIGNYRGSVREGGQPGIGDEAVGGNDTVGEG